MEINNFMSPGTDGFGRKYPLEITCKDGSVYFGHIKGHNSAVKEINFLLLESNEDWINRREPDVQHRENITIHTEAIDNIRVFKDY
jgi:hypothetical protein